MAELLKSHKREANQVSRQRGDEAFGKRCDSRSVKIRELKMVVVTIAQF